MSFEDLPTIDYVDGVAYYIWKRFEVRIHPNKGWAVFAKEDILSYDATMPYGGEEIFEDVFVAMMLRDPKEKAFEYVVAGHDGENQSWLDANPTLYPQDKPRHAWIGSIVNEPGPGEEVNAELFTWSTWSGIKIPKYPLITINRRTAFVVIEIIKDVKAGEEIMVNYRLDDGVREELYAYSLNKRVQRGMFEIDYTRFYEARKLNGINLQKRKAEKRIRKKVIGARIRAAKDYKLLA